ncbi:extracellular metalloprotease [Virgisporangium aliadipatigenens]|uniref:Serine protease n=1 Tax=Virgisporangium aliadipatigenens TaxID=741659 RepID=A0A8J3YFL5_9ACTN|nr:trypsin-like serine protease [Virgisporangium aliadipatigenens]GIJ43133.1 extracellular metalloprotease [Virgisporangium aliadipatigenens]
MHAHRMRAGTLATGFAAALAAVLAAAGPVSAAPAPAPALAADTPVSSDGAKVSPSPALGLTAARGESGRVGTGPGLTLNSTAPSGSSTTALGTESIIGTDDRIRITPATSFPASAVVQITRNGNAHCTGWLYGPDIVATAGHCVNEGAGGAWYTGLVVWPGRDGSSTPYGSCTVRQSWSVNGWIVDGNEEYDYGALKLNCTVGNSTGWFGYWWQSASLNGYSTLINGYPGDKPFGQQWRGDYVSRTVVATTGNQVFYTNDTIGGMSGSAVYQYRASGSSFCSGYCSMAIHGYGVHGSSPHTNNHAARITEARFNNLQAWKNAP